MARMIADLFRNFFRRAGQDQPTPIPQLRPSRRSLALPLNRLLGPGTPARRALPRLLLTPAAFLLAAFFSGPASLATPLGSTTRASAALSPDALLANAMQEVAGERFDKALEHIDALLKLRPNFRLAHLIKGDLLVARARPLSNLGSGVNAPAERITDLREEAVARLRAYRERPSEGKLPRYLMKLKPEQQYAIVVDTNRSRMYLYRNEGETPRFVAD